jgi:hypothetical protein
MTGYMQIVWPTKTPRDWQVMTYSNIFTSRRIFSLSGTASINPANFSLAVASSSGVRETQSAGKKGFAIFFLLEELLD